MSERRWDRGPGPRSDAQVLAHENDMAILEAIAAGRYVRTPESRWDLRRFDRGGLLLAGSAVSSQPVLTPRGERLVQVLHGLMPAPAEQEPRPTYGKRRCRRSISTCDAT